MAHRNLRQRNHRRQIGRARKAGNVRRWQERIAQARISRTVHRQHQRGLPGKAGTAL